MLKLTENNIEIPVSSHNNIVSATNKFQRTILTPKEVSFGTNHSTTLRL
jgi:hypothetical protein